jgi:hypothetical protein
MKPIEPNPKPANQTDSIGSPLFIVDAVPLEIPPERRKIDPSTIRWPEGVPKPWEQHEPPGTGGSPTSRPPK